MYCRNLKKILNICAKSTSSHFRLTGTHPGLRSRYRSELYSFRDSGTGTIFGIRFWFRVQGNEAKISKKFIKSSINFFLVGIGIGIGIDKGIGMCTGTGAGIGKGTGISIGIGKYMYCISICSVYVYV
jgi:hypothetical protein